MFKKIIVLLVLSMTTQVFGNVKIEDIQFSTGEESKVTIQLNENLKVTPELSVKDNIIQLEIPGTYVWPKIEKKISWGTNSFDSTITAYQYNKNLVRFRAILPIDMTSQTNNIVVNEKKNSLEITFPNHNVATAVKKETKHVEKKTAQMDDDAFLNQLITQTNENKAEVVNTNPEKNANQYFEDKIQRKQSGEQKNGENGFSFNRYLMKFVAFLGLILLGFYAVVILMKKGVVKKGRLGFLNSTKMVEVLSTTYVAPKRSVIMLKAHKQVFLIGTSEKGMHFLSEINDVNGLFKESEKQISGSNFDSNMVDAESEEKEFNLKEVLTESEGVDANRVEASKKVTDKVSLSDQIKKKVQGLKPLQ